VEAAPGVLQESAIQGHAVGRLVPTRFFVPVRGWVEVADEELGGRPGAPAWGATAFRVGFISGVCLLLQTALFLIDAVGVLPSGPDYRETGAGRGEDLAAYYVAYFERQHDVLWSTALSSVLGLVAATALIVLALALVRLRGQSRPGPQAWAAVFSVGALLLLLSDVVLLSQLAVYRDSGFTPEFPADIIAVGRASEAIDSLSGYLGSVGELVLAAALFGLAGLLSRPVALLARVLAAVLLVSVISWQVGPGNVYTIAAVLSGLLLGPAVLVATGFLLRRVSARDHAGEPTGAVPLAPG
jgi:hypothetical protein